MKNHWIKTYVKIEPVSNGHFELEIYLNEKCVECILGVTMDNIVNASLCSNLISIESICGLEEGFEMAKKMYKITDADVHVFAKKEATWKTAFIVKKK